MECHPTESKATCCASSPSKAWGSAIEVDARLPPRRHYALWKKSTLLLHLKQYIRFGRLSSRCECRPKTRASSPAFASPSRRSALHALDADQRPAAAGRQSQQLNSFTCPPFSDLITGAGRNGHRRPLIARAGSGSQPATLAPAMQRQDPRKPETRLRSTVTSADSAHGQVQSKPSWRAVACTKGAQVGPSPRTSATCRAAESALLRSFTPRRSGQRGQDSSTD